ncbi:uncharacterized protein LOC128168797 [Crassostrea angulata]|uniref:uncharacterized protein LOC128168797 n=1 Tax=Magallana angulata TaxID=2784310 RepID=UPI0022B21C01|nr:uncharacterized protein LOC128168797 [Crassostrea angulata]
MVTEQDPFCRQGEDSESLSQMKNDAGKCFQHYQDNAVETHPNNDNKGNGAEACPHDAQEDTTDPCANMVTEQDPFCRQGEDSESLNQVTYSFNATIKKGKVLNELSKYW